ncbi:MAG: PQQ-binding-like beta-propeller repeat protein [Planctomycetota bacterium]
MSAYIFTRLAAHRFVFVWVLSCSAGMLAYAADGSDWLQWRGSSRDSVASANPTWPDRLADDFFSEQWSVPLGPSYSGPIVLADRVFTTETKDQAQEVVHAFDRVSGGKLWEASWDGAMSVPFFAAANGSWIRATPACDGSRLFVAGMRDLLVCLDVESGNELWRVDFMQRYGTPLPKFGFASSPMVVDGHVYVQASQSLVKLDALTGASVWRTAGTDDAMYGSPFSSPLMGTVDGRRQILLQTRSSLKGIDPADGAELWSQEIEAFRGMNILTPTIYGDGVFTSAHSGKSQFWTVSAAANQGEAVTEQWTNKAQAYMSSPVIVGDYVYLHLRNQRLSCIDLKNGEEQWRTKPYGKYWSMVAQGDRILALDERGKLLLFRANPAEFELLDERDVAGDSTWAHLAVCGGQVFVRALDRLTVYRWQ